MESLILAQKITLHAVYNILISLVNWVLPISKGFSPKMKYFVEGRKNSFQRLVEKIKPSDKVIWLHAASLGEYEQGLPILENLKSVYPGHKILLTFFSPSGYEVKKNNTLADLTFYLPIDTPRNAKRFVQLAHPDLAVFVKYEIWPNYMKYLTLQSTKSILISGNFRKEQIYFKSYGLFMKKALMKFDYLFVQNRSSYDLLKSNGIKNVQISGDTRFDRVSKQLTMDNHLDFIEKFKQDKLCVVCGSTWPEDEDFLVGYINDSPNEVKFIIAPHEIQPQKIRDLENKLKVSFVSYTQMNDTPSLASYKVFILDTVGFLSKAYAYGDIAYVGGAAGHTGLHNILEPATFGLPVIIGPHYKKFPEAQDLKKHGGLVIAENREKCYEILIELTENESKRIETGKKSADFIKSNIGAEDIIMGWITENY